MQEGYCSRLLIISFFLQLSALNKSRTTAGTDTQAEPPQMQTEILKDYVSREQLAAEFGKSTKTLIRWELDGSGPPVTRIGREPLYYRPSVQKWLRSQEQVAQATTSTQAA
jgi:hypothetical protein